MEVSPTETISGDLVPYNTATPNPKSDVEFTQITNTPYLTPNPTPTITPLVYQVVENDTLTGIANLHAVSLEDLIAANPGIDPNFLTIGLTLTIPINGIVSAEIPKSTPISIILQPPVCYPRVDDSLQCISVVENNQNFPVENITVEISLESQDGLESISQIAITPQNIVRPGEKAAVAASFPPLVLKSYISRSRLLSVIPVSDDDQRYLETDLNLQEVVISGEGKKASIKGSVEVLFKPLEEPQVAGSVWVLVFAFDDQDNIIGTRKWVAEGEFLSGNLVFFSFDVYSIGPAIDHVEILTEARP